MIVQWKQIIWVLNDRYGLLKKQNNQEHNLKHFFVTSIAISKFQELNNFYIHSF